MNSGTKGYLIIAGIVLYHVAALYAIMLLFDLHVLIASLAGLAWFLSLPITAWKSAKFAGRYLDGIAQENTTISDDSKE